MLVPVCVKNDNNVALSIIENGSRYSILPVLLHKNGGFKDVNSQELFSENFDSKETEVWHSFDCKPFVSNNFNCALRDCLKFLSAHYNCNAYIGLQ